MESVEKLPKRKGGRPRTYNIESNPITEHTLEPIPTPTPEPSEPEQPLEQVSTALPVGSEQLEQPEKQQ